MIDATRLAPRQVARLDCQIETNVGAEMRYLAMLPALLAFTAAPATAQQPAQQQAAQEKVICKRQVDADTGSHFSSSRRVCMKASDWKRLDDETQRALTTANNRGGFAPVPTKTMGGSPQ